MPTPVAKSSETERSADVERLKPDDNLRIHAMSQLGSIEMISPYSMTPIGDYIGHLEAMVDIAHLRIVKRERALADERAAHEGWQQEHLRLAAHRWITVSERLPDERRLVIGKWAPVGERQFQTIQVAFVQFGKWYAWHYGSFASRLIAPVAWVPIAAPTPDCDYFETGEPE